MELLDDIAFPAPISERVLHSDRHMADVRSDLAGFLKTYFNFPDDDWKPQHVYAAMSMMFEGGKLVFQWATDHAKSDTGTFYFPIASLCENPDESHIFVGANFNDAKRRLQKVSRELETNHALLKDFPWLKKPTKPRHGSGGVTWSRTEITVAGRSANKANPSIYAGTIGSDDIRGRRGKLIMDDIEGKQSRLRASVREELYEFVKLEAVRCLEDLAESARPLLCAMGTPFDIDSIYLKLQDEDWKVIKVPAYAVPYDKIHQSAIMTAKYGDKQATPWQTRASRLPDRYFTWPRKRLKVTENDPYFGRGMTKTQFSISYLLDATAGDPMRLSVLQMRKLVEKAEFPQQDNWITVVSIDPAAGVGEDYAGISVIRIRWPGDQELPQVEVLEAHRFEQGLFEQVHFVSELAYKYGPDERHPCRVVYESNAQQGGTYRNAFGHMHPEIQLVPIYTSAGAKFDEKMGLTVIRSLVKREHLKVPASTLDSEGVQTLLREVRDLGTSAHDHIACSVWFAVHWLYDQVRAYNGPPLLAAPAGRLGFGSGLVGAGGAVPSWRTWRR